MPYYKVCPKCRGIFAEHFGFCVNCLSQLRVEWLSFKVEDYFSEEVDIKPVNPKEILGGQGLLHHDEDE